MGKARGIYVENVLDLKCHFCHCLKAGPALESGNELSLFGAEMALFGAELALGMALSLSL